MAKLFKKSAKILTPVILAGLLAMSVFAATPGFSDGEPSQTADVPSGGTIELVDPNTGAGVDIPVRNLPDGVTQVSFESTIIPESSLIYQNATNAAAQLANELGVTIVVNEVIDLKLFDQNGNNIKILNGEIIVSLPVKGKSNAGAYFNDETGKMEILPSRVRNGFIEFKTNHFSYFALIEAPASVIPDFAESAAPVATDSVPSAIESVPEEPVYVIPEITAAEIAEIADNASVEVESEIIIPVEVTDKASHEPLKSNPLTGDTIGIFLAFLALAGAAGTAAFFTAKKIRAN